MLQYLRIKNLALLETTSLEFGPGFTAVTGETGAGKSVLLGALAFLSGTRADKTVIGQYGDACELEAVLYFQQTAALDAALEELALPPCEDGSLVLRRVISRSKAPKVTINGALATQGALQALGEHWVDFHGPGEPQKLFHEEHQLGMLDLFAGNEKSLADYQSQYRAWQRVLKEHEALAQGERLSPDELEFYQGQVDKIDEVAPSAEAVESLERQFNRKARYEELAQLSQSVSAAFNDEGGIVEILGQCVKPVQELAELDDNAQALAARVEGLIIECEDLAGEYARFMDVEDAEDVSYEDIEAKMNHWLELKRRYGPSVEQVLAKREALAKKIALQSDIKGALSCLEAEAASLEQEAGMLAKALAKKRTQAGASLAKKVEHLLGSLGFKKARFSIEITEEAKLRDTGNVRCTFLFAPNVGQPLLPLSKIASSGETARVMLALKTVLAEVDETPLLIFDEVDANVGGEIGAQVGKRLKALAASHQVLCVTHLPQVAAQAEAHFVVTKKQTKQTTQVAIESLHEAQEGRVVELARMLGDRSSASALKHAEELLGV